MPDDAIDPTIQPASATEPDATVRASVPALAATDLTGLPAIDGYDIVRELGRGGMGVVYEAVQRGLNRRVALKMILSGRFTSAEDEVRFLIEAESLARLQHPNIVQIHDVGRQAGLPYFALEYVAGGTLASYAGGDPLPPPQAAEIVEAVARGVQHAHAQGVIHRDLKPANILLQGVGDRVEGIAENSPGLLHPPPYTLHPLPKVTDFGLAKLAGSSDVVTLAGSVLGTPSYMAPEQASGGSVGTAADVYSLGAILYYLLTGRPPFRADTVAATLAQVRTDPPTDPRTKNPLVPRDLAVVCLKCLEKDPRRRYDTAAALADDLERWRTDRPITARPVGGGERIYRWCRRHPVETGLLALLLLAIVGGVSGIVVQLQNTRSALAESKANAERAEANFALAEQAVETYLTGVSDDPQLKEPGQAALRKRLIGTAREFYQRFADTKGDDPAYRKKLATAHLKLGIIAADADGDDATALDHLDRSRQAHLALPDGRRGLIDTDHWTGVCLLRRGDLDGGFAAFRRAVDACRDSASEPAGLERLARETNHLARELTARGRYAEAVPFSKEHLAAVRATIAGSPPAEADPLRELGHLYRVTNDPLAAETLAAAETASRAAVAAEPGNVERQFGLVAVLFDRSFMTDAATAEKQLGEAANLLTGIIARRVSPEARQLLVAVHLKQTDLRLAAGDYETPLAFLASALQRADHTGDGILTLCEAATRAREAALADATITPDARKQRAGSFQVLIDQALARDFPDPTTPAGLARLAWLAAGQLPAPAAQLQRAKRLAERAVARAPGDAVAQSAVALTSYRGGDYAGARRAMLAANRTDRLGAYLLAMTLAATGDTTAAREKLTAAAALPATTAAGELNRFREEAEAAAAGQFAITPPTQWRADIDLSRGDLQNWIDRLTNDGYVPVAVHAHRTAAGVRYAGIASHSGRTPRWQLVESETIDGFQRQFNELNRSLWVASLCGHATVGLAPGFVSVWTSDRPIGLCRHAVNPPFLIAEAAQRRGTGQRPISLSVYPLDGQPVFAVVYGPDAGLEWELTDELTWDGAKQLFARNDGWRPGPVCAFTAGGTPRITVVRLRDPGTPFVAKFDLTVDQFRSEAEAQAKAGYQPDQVIGYDAGGQSRYFGVWTKPPATTTAPPPPATGTAVPELSGFDAAVQTYMADRGIPAGSLAVMKDGKLVLSRGYGFLDRGRTKPTPPDAPFRIASLSKPITAAAIRNLIAGGKLTADTKIAPLLKLTGITDPRWNDVTVGHLLDHRGGFDRAKGDPMFRPTEIAAALKIAGPPSAADVVRYQATQPLQYAPGKKSVYSNFGYCLLGRVIETVSGQEYTAHVREKLLAPIGVTGVHLGRTLPDRRDPREPYYNDPNREPDVMRPGGGLVSAPDGGFHLEAMDAHGGLIAPAADLVRFLHKYGTDGRPAGRGEEGFFGSLPGTWTVMARLPDGVLVAALFNQRVDPSGKEYDEILAALRQAAKETGRWP